MARVAIYLRPNEDHGDEAQRERCMLDAIRAGDEVTVIASDLGDERRGWDGLVSMVDGGAIDEVIVAPQVEVPLPPFVRVAGWGGEPRRPKLV